MIEPAQCMTSSYQTRATSGNHRLGFHISKAASILSQFYVSFDCVNLNEQCADRYKIFVLIVAKQMRKLLLAESIVGLYGNANSRDITEHSQLIGTILGKNDTTHYCHKLQ